MIATHLKTLRVVLPYLKKYSVLYVLGFAFMLIQNYGFVKFPEYMRLALEEITGSNRPEEVQNLLLVTGFYLLITCFFMYISRYLIIGTSRRIEYSFRKDLYHKLLHLPVQFYKKEQTGDLVSRITQDLNDVRTMLGPGIMYIPNSLSRLAFFLPVMIALSGKLMGWIMGLITFIVVIILIVMPILRPFYKRIQEVRAKLNNEAWQFIFGISTIKTNTMEKVKTQQFDKLSRKYMRENIRLSVVEGFTWPFFFFIFSLSGVLILVVGGTEVINGTMTLEELLQFNIMLGILTFSVFSLGWVMSLLQQGISALERINHFFLEPTDNLHKKESLDHKKPLDLVMKNVSLRGENNLSVLENISMHVRPGEMIGLTGKTGSGKTTLLEIIMGLTVPTSGSVRLGGKDLFTLDPQSFYKIVAFVPQETFLFSTSIKNNIGFEEEHDPSFPKVIQSAKLSDVHKDIETFADKYEQVLGERGITLSGGQKQRTAIGRSLYKEANILVLDDSLSSVDSETEENIINNLKSLKNIKTIIIASHKVSLLKFADRILFLEDGQMLEEGDHDTLMQKDGAYARMAQLQKLQASIES